MRKTELVRLVSRRAQVTQDDTKSVIEAFEDEIMDELCRGGRILFPRLGVVGIEQRGPRVGRNPKTGQEVRIAPRAAPVFRPSQGLRSAVEQITNNGSAGTKTANLDPAFPHASRQPDDSTMQLCLPRKGI